MPTVDFWMETFTVVSDQPRQSKAEFRKENIVAAQLLADARGASQWWGTAGDKPALQPDPSPAAVRQRPFCCMLSARSWSA